MDLSFKKGIVGGLVSSAIFVYLLQPGVNHLSHLAMFLSRLFSDHIYVNAAYGQRNYVEVMSFDLTCGIVTGALTAMVLMMFLNPKEENSSSKNEHLLKRPKTKFIVKWASALVAAMWIFFSVYVMTLVSSDMQLNTSFHQRLDAINPYLKDWQTKQLLSAWALMKNKKDYETICAYMETVGKQNKLDLPPRLF